MPVYEYYCEDCDGIFEALRPMTKASEPVPCIQCERDAVRIMPTSFTAFTFREGYPRRLPDKGTYWHLEKEVKTKIRGYFKPFEHPETTPPKTPKRLSKGEVQIAREKRREQQKELKRMRDSGLRATPSRLPRKLR
jgi:putative FmdB family regulatory protein